MICLVGDILTDVTLATAATPLKMRLGGVVHAARALWAMGVDYAVAYFAPAYLDSHIVMYLNELDCKAVIKLGNVTNSPYTMLIGEAKEVGIQGYEFLYHDGIEIIYDEGALKKLYDYAELMFISGNFDMLKVLEVVGDQVKLHCDVANNLHTVEQLPERLFESLFISTSSDIFKNQYRDFNSFCELLQLKTRHIVLKENRGGSRIYDTTTGAIYKIPSQTTAIQHSVGVGDVYDVVSIVAPYEKYEQRLYLASWVAMEYASTTFPDEFKKAVQRLLKTNIADIMAQRGCFLPWEVRKKCHIYIAAPDFDFVDTTEIDRLYESLLYHNFVPHRPVKENGQMPDNADKQERLRLFSADMSLLAQCNMTIVVLLYNDPGTLIEIGLSAQRKMPTIVYNPLGIATNCMLTELPILVSCNLDEIVAKVFNEYSKQYANGTL